MDQTLFDDLVQSLKEAKAISRGEMSAARRTRIDAPDVKAVREQIGLSQSEFAQLMHVSIKTLQNWEQHRRNPLARQRPCSRSSPPRRMWHSRRCMPDAGFIGAGFIGGTYKGHPR